MTLLTVMVNGDPKTMVGLHKYRDGWLVREETDGETPARVIFIPNAMLEKARQDNGPATK